MEQEDIDKTSHGEKDTDTDPDPKPVLSPPTTIATTSTSSTSTILSAPSPNPPATPTPPTATPTTPSPNLVNPPNGPLIRFPPFPPIPEGVTILPFKSFREHGIQIFASGEYGDDEVDGLGIPTVALRVPHDTDVSKTEAGKKKKKKKRGRGKKEGDGGDEDGDGDGDGEGEEEDGEEPGIGKKGGKRKARIGDIQAEDKKLTPLERAQEQRRKRLLLFANNPWYIQWAEGEDLRGTKIYDTNLSPIDRIHMAATEFRTGRIWPPGHTRVGYLWDQFRLFAGLLGSPPVWIRTDLAQPSDYGSSSEEEDEDDDDPKSHKARVDSASDSESEFLDPYAPDKSQKSTPTTPTAQPQQPPDEKKRKRIPPRTPYGLANLTPILVSSDAQVRALLALSSTRRENKLLRFLADPEHATRVFLSWYLRHEGLMWSPVHLVALPHLVRYFLAFVVRVRALPESERALKKAVEVARRAVEELPKMGRLCRALPDKVGVGAKAMWGARWVDKEWGWAGGGVQDAEEVQDEHEDEKKKKEEMRKFEEELKKENFILMSADPAELGRASAEQQLASVREEAEDVLDEDVVEQPQEESTNADRAGFFEQLAQAYGDDTTPKEDEKPRAPPTMRMWPQRRRDADDDSSDEDEAHNTRHLHDWANPSGPRKRSAEEAAAAWAPSTEQPLMELLGMTVFPFKYDVVGGVVERSMRRVKAVYKPGEVDKSKKWKGLDEELVKRLARVVLSPWIDWEEEKVKKEEDEDERVPYDYRDPEVRMPDGSDTKHDALQDDITLLLDPRVAELVCIGVGIAGTWVQLVPVREEFGAGGGRGRGRGRGRGWGRGGRGGSHSNAGSGQTETSFWYVEEIYMAIPSFWTLGEPEEELVLPDDFESLLEDEL
ncbi:hypothetical protein M413DRAFT_449986 [Hebeloma cylindrosporum]|uniref:Uncharacterized protein n=1 Tax=Hebeloma cylindrosporum TaxID=76867 RepID=A0A0C3BDR0_HEBCY|nr:hypothetical protein M413DRAFT_449986 [Hebeloma cylindrosporum h7]